MKKVLVLERPLPIKPSGYDHIFSFCSNEADSFPEDYLNQDDLEQYYDEIYDVICSGLQNHGWKESFSYRGVDLFWCFKKLLFDYAYHSRLRYETFKRVMADHGVSQLDLAEKREHPELPFLCQILPISPLKGSFCLSTEKGEESAHETERGRKDWESYFWPSCLRIGGVSSCRVAIFSDLRKSESLVSPLKSHRCVLVSNGPSPKSLVACIRLKAAFFQFIFHERHGEGYVRKKEEYCGRLRASRVFATFHFGDLDGQRLLETRLEALFESTLPRLLFEIDSAHRFFQEARSLKSLLLDEDVLPNKNAFCQVARQYGVATFVECHGSVGHKIGFLPLTADRLFVWGRAQGNKLMKWGCPAERIIVSGCSRYRQYQIRDGEEAKAQVARKLKLDPSKKIIVAAPTPVPSRRFLFERSMRMANSEILNALRDVIQETNAQFVVKLHPRDQRLGEYRGWIRSQGLATRGALIKDFDSLLLIRAADLVVVYSSTFAIDAFAMGKPVICAWGDSNSWLKEFRPFRVFYYVDHREDLKRIMSDILQGERPRSPFWDEGRRECLNEGESPPEETIVHHLLTGPAKTGVHAEVRPSVLSR